jgi:hypothetical protein
MVGQQHSGIQSLPNVQAQGIVEEMKKVEQSSPLGAGKRND